MGSRAKDCCDELGVSARGFGICEKVGEDELKDMKGSCGNLSGN